MLAEGLKSDRKHGRLRRKCFVGSHSGRPKYFFRFGDHGYFKCIEGSELPSKLVLVHVNSSRDFNLIISWGTSPIGLKSTLRDFNFKSFKITVRCYTL